ncbi:hypothetical protein CQA85_01725 [Streptococcus salivarius]|nr:hypothetical protein CQA85_01725 [Streptococcus salivarius]
MNKNEAVQKLATVGRLSIAHAEDLYDSFFPKPVVPQYVADWYEENKEEFEVNLFQSVYEASDGYTLSSTNKFWHWLMSKDIDALTTLVNMHQFGYEVAKEARYTVRVKGIKGDKQWLVFSELTECLWFGTKEESHYAVLEHTRKELESNGFGWVFDCEGIEVKEVDDEND